MRSSQSRQDGDALEQGDGDEERVALHQDTRYNKEVYLELNNNNKEEVKGKIDL